MALSQTNFNELEIENFINYTNIYIDISMSYI